MSIGSTDTFRCCPGANFSKVGSFGRLCKVSAIVEASKQFQIADEDGNGTLDEDEFAKLLMQMGMKVAAEEASLLFTKIDTDGSVVISNFVQQTIARKCQIIFVWFICLLLILGVVEFTMHDQHSAFSLICVPIHSNSSKQ